MLRRLKVMANFPLAFWNGGRIWPSSRYAGYFTISSIDAMDGIGFG